MKFHQLKMNNRILIFFAFSILFLILNFSYSFAAPDVVASCNDITIYAGNTWPSSGKIINYSTVNGESTTCAPPTCEGSWARLTGTLSCSASTFTCPSGDGFACDLTHGCANQNNTGADLIRTYEVTAFAENGEGPASDTDQCILKVRRDERPFWGTRYNYTG